MNALVLPVGPYGILAACALALPASALAAPQALQPSPTAAQAPQGETSPARVALPSAPELDAAAIAALEAVLVDHDDFVLERSARVRFADAVLADPGNDGVLVVRGDGLVIAFEDAPLRGAADELAPDRFTGIGIRVEGKGVRLHAPLVRGFRIGIEARGADGLVLEDADVSGNFRQRLKSTPLQEDGADWLSPHQNDGEEWVRNYGAGIHVKNASDVTVRRCRARAGQNGLILDRVTKSKVFDNDFAFLSGWGIAMWRSSNNVLSRNLLDFCVRGYSHGVYNRGQDSAGLLLFEQCSDNVIALNSMAHCGDGVFGFAGLEALGDVPAPEGFDYRGKGCNANLFAQNDLSYAAAHGYEMTFSFKNVVFGNRLAFNAICGVWAGYSQESTFARNTFVGNGEGAYGAERGGINIEHGKKNLIHDNRFRDDACGIALWWDEDAHLADKPWVLANGAECGESWLFKNAFLREKVAVEVRDCPGVVYQQLTFEECGDEILATEGKQPKIEPVILAPPQMPSHPEFGARNAVGELRHLHGREHIVMTEWGPYDWSAPLLWRGPDKDGAHVWHVLLPELVTGTLASAPDLAITAEGAVKTETASGLLGPEVLVRFEGDAPPSYSLAVEAGALRLSGAFAGTGANAASKDG